jgi:hypothetical protein
MDDDNWIKLWHFEGHRPSTEAFSKINQGSMENARKWSTRTAWISISAGFFSIVSAVAGGITLILSLLVVRT